MLMMQSCNYSCRAQHNGLQKHSEDEDESALGIMYKPVLMNTVWW